MRKLINKIFKYETMDGDGVCPVYLERWELLSLFGYEIYLHHFLGDDWAIDPHDHPRRFISIGLWGSYIEQAYTITEKKIQGMGMGGIVKETSYIEKKFSAPWCRSFPARHLHRIRMEKKGDKAWTLVIVLRKERGWGFVMKGQWIHWREYVKTFGKERKSC